MINKKIAIGGFSILAIIILIISLQYKNFTILQSKNDTQQNQDRQKQKIQIGYSAISIASVPLFIAQSQGFFEKHDLIATLYTQQNPSIGVKALMGKELDYLAGGTGEVTLAGLKGLPIKTIMFFTKSNPTFLIGQKDLKINDIKKIGVVIGGTLVNYIAQNFISKNNLSAEIIKLNSMAALTAALNANQVDAIVRSIPEALKLEAEGFAVLEDMSTEMGMGISASDDKIKNNSEEVKEVIGALQDAIAFMKNDSEGTKKVLFDLWKMEKNESNEKIIDKFYSLLKESLSEKGLPDGNGVNISIQIAKAGDFKSSDDVDNQIVTPEDIAKSFDFGFIK